MTTVKTMMKAQPILAMTPAIKPINVPKPTVPALNKSRLAMYSPKAAPISGPKKMAKNMPVNERIAPITVPITLPQMACLLAPVNFAPKVPAT